MSLGRLHAQEALRAGRGDGLGPDDLGRLVELATGDQQLAAAAARRRGLELAELQLAATRGRGA